MRLATWNVNSIRARVDRIVDFAVREHIDVLAMQEIKCKEEQFPYEAFEAAGFEVRAHGFSQWNGVAVASREPMTDVETAFPGMPGFAKGHEGPDAPQEARAIGIVILDPVENGRADIGGHGSVADRAGQGAAGDPRLARERLFARQARRKFGSA